MRRDACGEWMDGLKEWGEMNECEWLTVVLSPHLLSGPSRSEIHKVT